jgi:N-acetylglucosamine transport system permease protein
VSGVTQRPRLQPAPTTPPTRATGAGERAVAVSSHTVLGIWSLLVLVPLLWTIVSSFKTTNEIFASPFSLPREWQFQNYVTAWRTAGIGTYFLNSVIVVSCARPTCWPGSSSAAAR